MRPRHKYPQGYLSLGLTPDDTWGSCCYFRAIQGGTHRPDVQSQRYEESGAMALHARRPGWPLILGAQLSFRVSHMDGANDTCSRHICISEVVFFFYSLDIC